MNTITLVSLANGNKPSTIVEGDCEGIRMREPTELVHLRDEDESRAICSICGKRANVWLSSADRHSVHPSRCI